jgi:thiol-disulfide isomerase/thioredoxin
MKKLRAFWGVFPLIFLLPIFLFQLIEAFMAWKTEIKEEMIYAVHFLPDDKQLKTAVLDNFLKNEVEINLKIYGFSFLLLISIGVIFFILRQSNQRNRLPVYPFLGVTALLIGLSIIAQTVWYSINKEEKTTIIDDSSIENISDLLNHKMLVNKTVYGDFWGTTCGPCLWEIRNFTKSLKYKYAGKEVTFLYIGRGNKLLWQKLLKKYNMQGVHVFLEDEKYDRIFRNVAANEKEPIEIPRYFISDKRKNIVHRAALRPSDRDSLYHQIDATLTKR